MKRYRKKLLVVLGLFLILSLFVGSSYAFWKFSSTQENSSIAQTKCFRLTIMNESDAIFLSQAIPTSDEEGMKEKGYSFTIKNVCNTTATYQVNLEDLVSSKKLSQDYIRISLNESTPSNLSDYTPVKKTLEEAESSHKLTSGSLRPEEEVTYELKMWMNENTPAIESVMNATFESKVTILATYTEEGKLENEIELVANSANEGYSKEKEVFDIKASSVKYDIISYSEDKKKWTNVTPSKDFSLKKEYIKEGSYLFYVKDSVGNIKEIEIHTDFLDQTGPEIKYEEAHQQESVLLSIFGSDEKSGIKSYQITSKKEEPSEWKEFEGEKEEEILENGTYYIWMKDKVGNVSFVKYEAENIDQKAPEVTLRSELKDFGIKDYIEMVMKDDIIGLSGYQVMREEKEPEDWILLNQELSKTVTYEVEENGIYYVYVKDAYGHIAMSSIEITFIDKEGPTKPIVTSETGWTNQAVVVKITSEDTGSGIEAYEWKKDGEWTKEQIVMEGLEAQIIFQDEMNETISFRVIDKVGNESEITNIEVKIDQTKPSLPSVKNSSESVYVNTNVEIEVSSMDSLSGISKCLYSLDEQTWKEDLIFSNGVYKKTWSDEALAIPVWYKCIDQAGNESDIKRSDIHIDKVAPTFNMTEAYVLDGNNSWKKAVTLRLTGYDNLSAISGAKYCITTSNECDPQKQASLNSNNSFDVVLPNSNTAQKVCVKYFDHAGNSSYLVCSGAYYVDNTVPQVSFYGAVSGNSVTLYAQNSNDVHSGIKSYTFNGYSTQTSTYTFTGISDGVFNVTLTVEDWAGNTASSTIPIEVAYQTVYISANGNDSTGSGLQSNPLKTLSAGVNKVSPSGGTVALLTNIYEGSQVNVYNKTITIKCNTDLCTLLKNNGSIILLNADSGSNVTFTNIVVDGQNATTNYQLLNVNSGGVLNINSSTYIQHSSVAAVNVSANATLNVNGGTFQYNSGESGSVIQNYGTTSITNGTVYQNTSNNGNINNGGTMTIWSGWFYENKSTMAGGVFWNQGTLDIRGGEYYSNSVTNLYGGVLHQVSGTCYMYGGIMRNNSAPYGGAVYIQNEQGTSQFVLSGGTIQNNTASIRGGGVHVKLSPAKYTFNNGTISGNSPTNVYTCTTQMNHC